MAVLHWYYFLDDLLDYRNNCQSADVKPRYVTQWYSSGHFSKLTPKNTDCFFCILVFMIFINNSILGVVIFALHGQVENTGVFKNAKKAKKKKKLKQQNTKTQLQSNSIVRKPAFLWRTSHPCKKEERSNLGIIICQPFHFPKKLRLA